jgi:Rrf2 family protein
VIQLTRRGDYGVSAIYHIAQYPKGHFISIEEISAKTGIPKPYLSKIFQDLCRGGILLSRRGTGGGFTLARSTQEISLKNIIDIVEGKMYIVMCLNASEQCSRANGCPIAAFWREIQGFMDDLIGSIMVEDLVNQEKRQKMLLQLETCRNLYREKVRTMKE